MREVMRDAAIALAVRDLISQEHFDALYGPWASAMEAEVSEVVAGPEWTL